VPANPAAKDIMERFRQAFILELGEAGWKHVQGRRMGRQRDHGDFGNHERIIKIGKERYKDTSGPGTATIYPWHLYVLKEGIDMNLLLDEIASSGGTTIGKNYIELEWSGNDNNFPRFFEHIISK
jgi:hypothetical protein